MKITTLIPAYKPKYLPELVQSLRCQAVKPARVLLSDDSPDQAFVHAFQGSELASVAEQLQLTVVPGPRAGGAFANLRQLLKAWDGETELFHFLLDDDILYPSFYERHLAAHRGQNYPCTVSRRWTADEAGHPVGQLALPKAIYEHGQRLLSVDASALFGSTLPNCHNWLGEFSNCVFRRELAPSIEQHELESVSFYGLIDLGTFLNASLRGPVGFLNEALGAFRMGPQQNTADIMGRNMKLSHLAWLSLALGGRRAGRLTPAQATQSFTRMGGLITSRYARTPDMAPFCAVIPRLIAGQTGSEDDFLALWRAYIVEPGDARTATVPSHE